MGDGPGALAAASSLRPEDLMEHVHPHRETALPVPILPNSHVGLLVCILIHRELMGKAGGENHSWVVGKD